MTTVHKKGRPIDSIVAFGTASYIHVYFILVDL